MDRRTRICIWIILLGLGNFFLYTIVYMFLGGEAVTGEVTTDGRYFLHPRGDDPNGVPRWVFLYSGIHSISIWPTVAAIMLSMLTLAKERITSSMRSAIVRGRTFITILATGITVMTLVITIWFTLHFARNLTHPVPPPGEGTESIQNVSGDERG